LYLAAELKRNEEKGSTSKYAAALSECFSFVLAIKMSQKTDHHSKRKPPGASIAAFYHDIKK